MNHTRWVQLFIRLLPFGSGLSSRLRRHLEQCPECLGRMADIQEAQAATVGKNDLGKLKDYWPRLSLGLQHPERRKHSGFKLGWAWAMGAAGFMALTIIGLFFRVPPSQEEALSSGVKLRINYVRMYEQPAQAFIFHTQDANSTFVWVEKQKSGEVL